MPDRRINKVVVLGATGNIGRPIVEALLAHSSNFEVSAVTRDKTTASFPEGVRVLQSDYSIGSLRSIFTSQDAIVSTMTASSASQQIKIIDIAIEANVVRFIPTEYGLDTADAEAIAKFMPMTKTKPEIVKYLRSKEDSMSWSSVVVGSFFDWSLSIPGMMGWNIPERSAVIYDGGDREYEATNTAQIARAVAAIVAPEHQDITANHYIYVNSFTLTQDQVLAALEKATGDKFETTQASAAELYSEAMSELGQDPKAAASGLIVSNLYNVGGLNRYSKYPGGLWNDCLGLPKEDVQEAVNAAVQSYKG